MLFIYILTGCIVYLSIGFITFKIWLQLVPPEYGIYKNLSWKDSRNLKVWFLPTISSNQKGLFLPFGLRNMFFVKKSIKTLMSKITYSLIPKTYSMPPQVLAEKPIDSEDTLRKEFEQLEHNVAIKNKNWLTAYR